MQTYISKETEYVYWDAERQIVKVVKNGFIKRQYIRY